MLREEEQPIGFYVHDHGYGHARRVSSVIRNLDRPATVLSTLDHQWDDLKPDTRFIHLPSEDLIEPVYKQSDNIPAHFHYLPLGVKGVAERNAIIADYIARQEPLMMFVDVSVEIVHLARMCSVPVAVPRMHGNRNDQAHQAAYELASLLIAPFPEWGEQEDTPETVRKKTVYTGALCRFHDEEIDDRNPHDREYVLILTGGCEDIIDADRLNSWAEAHPEYDWIITGNYKLDTDDKQSLADNVILKTYVKNISSYLKHARYIVAPCSDNITAEIAFFGKPWICVPFSRPFNEQHCKAAVLERENIAVVCEDWPNSSMITYLMHKADSLDIEKQRSWTNSLAARAIAASFETFIHTNRLTAELTEQG